MGPVLTFTVGKSPTGQDIMLDFDKAAHVLVAGMTGSGKSVFMTAMLTELIGRYHPNRLVMHLIDPKRVELSRFAAAPHVLDPPAYDEGVAIGYLRWAVKEMNLRFREMERAGVRDAMHMPKPRAHYLIVIDELANLMLGARRTVEPLIARLATMGRAAGIHLVLGTQRPSADVLTGLIRSNVPTRICFPVLTSMDSRIILDQSGAEQLRSPGDILARLPGGRELHRLRGRYVSDIDAQRMVAWSIRQVAA